MRQLAAAILLFLLPLCLSAQGGEAELAEKYFQEEEYGNALALYEKVQRKDPSNRVYNVRIAECHKQLEQYEEAADFLEKTIRKNPDDHIYPFFLADIHRLTGDFKKADELETQTIEKDLSTDHEFMEIGTWLYQQRKIDLALRTYLEGRKELRSDYIFGSEIANLYSLQGEYARATEEYLAQYQVNPGILNTVRNNILSLVDAQSAAAIEEVLLKAVNSKSKDIGYRTILFEFYVLTENFYEAFVQCKSIDKVFKENGLRVYKFALTLRNNRKYELSNKALDYIIENHENSPYYLKSFQEKTVNGELQAFESIPLDTVAIQSAVRAYSDLLERFGRRPQFFDAIYRKANLLAFYLNDLDGALETLGHIADLQVAPPERAKADLLIGDILLMQKAYNRARLKYDNVAEAFHEGQIGAMAKFKQGRLSYFKGDFSYAQARLKSIKDNTSNDISNDAIQLFLVIQDNVGLDTTDYPLKRFAQAQLLVFQREFDTAVTLLDSILYAFPNHTLTDEIYWEKANVHIERHDVEKALTYLDKVIDQFGEDIHGDDALYTKARIYDFTLGDKEKAMELYIEFLKRYTGSLYIVAVRKRIRELRNERL